MYSETVNRKEFFEVVEDDSKGGGYVALAGTLK
jgi:hypothetical protein